MFKRLDNPACKQVSVTIDGQPVTVPEGETVAAAMLAQGLPSMRRTPVSGAARAPFCLMGVCYECLVVIDGRANQRSCMERVREGMRIECQQGTGASEP